MAVGVAENKPRVRAPESKPPPGAKHPLLGELSTLRIMASENSMGEASTPRKPLSRYSALYLWSKWGRRAWWLGIVA